MCFCGCVYEFSGGSSRGGDCNKSRDIKGCPTDEDFENTNERDDDDYYEEED